MDKVIRLKSDQEFNSMKLSVEFNSVTESYEPVLNIEGGSTVFLTDYEARLLSEQVLRAVRVAEKRNGAWPKDALASALSDYEMLEQELENNDM